MPDAGRTFAAIAAWVLAAAVLTGGCGRSGLLLPEQLSAPASSAPAMQDGGTPPRDPSAPPPTGPLRDAGAVPPSTMGHDPRPDAAVDAGAVDAGVVDAGPEDAGTADAEIIGPPPPPLRAGDDLVFSKQVGYVTSLFALHTADFSVRKLDPEPATQAVSGVPLAYSPDGRKLLVMEYRGDATVFAIAYRCRAASCAGQPQPYREVLRGPLDDALQATYSNSPFAPDSSGLVLQVATGAYYVPLPDDEPEPAQLLAESSELGATTYKEVHFVAGSAALLIQDDAQPRVELIDVRDWRSGALVHRRLETHGGASINYIASVSPDGEHFLAEPGYVAFATADVLAGVVTGRDLSPSARFVHAGDRWIGLLGDGGGELQSWDGSEHVPVADAGPGNLYGCDNQAVFYGPEHMFALDLAQSASVSMPPRQVTLADAPIGQPWFLDRCRKAVLRSSDHSQAWLFDLAGGSTLAQNTGLAYSRFNDHATLMMGGNYGIQSTYLVDTLGDATPVRYSPRMILGSSRVEFAHEAPFYLTSAPLLSAMDPRIFKVDFSDPHAVAVDPLTTEITEANRITLAPDDRHLAFGAYRPREAVVPADVHQGVFELDIESGQRELITAPAQMTMGGAERWQVIPGRRAVLVMGRYAGQPREGLFVANLDTGELVSQTPVEPAPRAILNTQFADDFTLNEDGSLVWYRSIAQAPSRFAQLLRFHQDEPLAPAKQLQFDPAKMGYAYEQADTTRGYFAGVGPVYEGHSGDPFGGNTDRTTIYYYDVAAGEQHLLAAAPDDDSFVYPTAISEQARAVILWRGLSGSNDQQSLSLVEPGKLDDERVIYSGGGLNGARVSPDGRWVEFTVGMGNELPTDMHFYDLSTHRDRVIGSAQIGASHVDYATFASDGRHVLIQNYDDQLFALDLESDDAPLLVAEGPVWQKQISADQRWAAFADQSGAYFARLDGSLQKRVVLATNAVTPQIQLSPSGHWLLVRTGTDPWQLYRTDAFEDGPVQLSGPAVSYMTFDASERYLAGSYDADGDEMLTVWKLDQPDSPHALLAKGEAGYSVWVDPAPAQL